MAFPAGSGAGFSGHGAVAAVAGVSQIEVRFGKYRGIHARDNVTTTDVGPERSAVG